MKTVYTLCNGVAARIRSYKKLKGDKFGIKFCHGEITICCTESKRIEKTKRDFPLNFLNEPQITHEQFNKILRKTLTRIKK